jgi:nitric oxide reductase large subunit
MIISIIFIIILILAVIALMLFCINVIEENEEIKLSNMELTEINYKLTQKLKQKNGKSN